jgi:hypothetical protein
MPRPDKTDRHPAAMTLPSCAAVPRRAGSIRRTSHVDMIPAPAGPVLDGAARNQVTTAAGATEVGRATVRAEVDAIGSGPGK